MKAELKQDIFKYMYENHDVMLMEDDFNELQDIFEKHSVDQEEYKGYIIRTKLICEPTNDKAYEIWKEGEFIRGLIGSLEMTKIIIDEIINKQENGK